MQRPPPQERDEHESLKDEVRNLLEEARMIVPGIQAIFGFQLIAVFNETFSDFNQAWKHLHLAAMFLILLAVLLIMTPAAYHRIAEPDQVSRRFTRLATALIAGAMVPLAGGIALEIMLIVYVIGDDTGYAAAAAIGTAAAFGLAWFGFPLAARLRRHARENARR